MGARAARRTVRSFPEDILAHNQGREAIRKGVDPSRLIRSRHAVWPDNVKSRIHVRDGKRMQRRAGKGQRAQIVRMRDLLKVSISQYNGILWLASLTISFRMSTGRSSNRRGRFAWVPGEPPFSLWLHWTAGLLEMALVSNGTGEASCPALDCSGAAEPCSQLGDVGLSSQETDSSSSDVFSDSALSAKSVSKLLRAMSSRKDPYSFATSWSDAVVARHGRRAQPERRMG